MKIIHCSDIHLDSKMETNLSSEKAIERNREICITFKNMLEYAKNSGVRIVMIAGDLFDTERISADTVDDILDAISKVPRVDVLYLRGNHDESENAFLGRSLPNNLKMFGSEWQYYIYNVESESVTIAGVELDAGNFESIYDNLHFSDDDGIHIAMMHGQSATQPGVDNVCIPRLKNKGIDYLALGHLHSYQINELDAHGIYCYSGCLEGRGFDECGEKGYVLLETAGGIIKSRFEPFAQRTLYDVRVDITGMESATEIRNAMQESSADLPRKSIVKFELTGGFTPDTANIKDCAYLQSEMVRYFYYVKVEDKSRLNLDPITYEKDNSLKGEFVRMVMSDESLSEENKMKIISYGIAALKGNKIELSD